MTTSYKRPLYMDYAATTPMDPRVAKKMMDFMTPDGEFGNPASRSHPYGWNAEAAVEEARKNVAALVNANPKEIIWTSGATESDNLAIKGAAHFYNKKGKHIITSKTEHKAVLDCCSHLEEKGAEITFVNVDTNGIIDMPMLEDAIRNDTILVIAMWANNETGVIHSIEDIGAVCARKGTLLFSDATQAVGKISVKPRDAGVQLLAMSAHKFYGPKGVGALYISNKSPRVKLDPLIDGGGHEGGNRSGTLNVPGIVGMGKALDIAWDEHLIENARLKILRDRLEAGLLAINNAVLNGGGDMRMSNVTNVRFEGTDAEKLMLSLQNELAIASGSACTAADPDPSHVLIAMGLTRDEAGSSLRFSLGRMNTVEEVDHVIELIASRVNLL